MKLAEEGKGLERLASPRPGLLGSNVTVPILCQREPSFQLMERRERMAGKKTVTQARSAKTGEFVTLNYAKTHPSTTVVEHNKVPKKK